MVAICDFMFIDHPLLVNNAERNAVATNPKDHPGDVVVHHSWYISAMCSMLIRRHRIVCFINENLSKKFDG